MRPYEARTDTTYQSDCPRCDCTITYTDKDDLAYEESYVTDCSDYIDDFSGYMTYSIRTGWILNSSYHECECECGFDKDPGDDIHSESWVEDETTYWACEECDRQYLNYAAAKSCCVQESRQELTAEQLAEQMINLSS
jgi:hypothetical protein